MGSMIHGVSGLSRVLQVLYISNSKLGVIRLKAVSVEGETYLPVISKQLFVICYSLLVTCQPYLWLIGEMMAMGLELTAMRRVDEQFDPELTAEGLTSSRYGLL